MISIFVLLLISVVAIALVVSSGTESSLAGNYRSATSVYYAALAGLEEARGRLSTKNPNSFSGTAPGFLPSPGTTLPVCSPSYVINPLGAEVVAPWDSTSAYADNQYGQEFTSSNCPALSTPPWTSSVWNSSPLNSFAFPGPLYKWVRISAVSEQSLNRTVSPYTHNSSNYDKSTPVFYDGTQLNISNAGAQVLEITSLAVLPNGSQKLLQYVVTPVVLNMTFPAALTMDGPINTFDSSFNSNFWISGVDRQHGSPYPGSCPPNDPTKYAVGAISPSSAQDIKDGIPPAPPGGPRYSDYVGTLGPTFPSGPSVDDISGSLMPAFQSVNALDGPQGLVQTIWAMADQKVVGPATSLPDLGAPDRPVVTVVRGDVSQVHEGDLNLGSVSGYGLLVVTGTLTVDGHFWWHGVILVIGQGSLKIPTLGDGEIDGAVLVARTRHSDGDLRSSFGGVTFDTINPNNSNNGFWYNSCWINNVIPAGGYKILSFHEISQ